jgi:hypothetical protein
MTTIIIALCAMRDILSSKDMEIEGDDNSRETKGELLKIVKDILYKYSIEQGRKSPRLVLQYEESKNYLSNLIEEKPNTDGSTLSIERMQDAYQTILEFLQKYASTEKLTLLEFVRYFLVNVEMVIIEPDDLGSALKIFETINERGVGLNAMDLLKNLLFSNTGEADFKKIKDIWKKIVGNLETCKESEKPLRFLRYFLIARHHNGTIREDEIYPWISSAEGKKLLKYQSHPVEFAKEILDVSVKYCAFIRATESWAEDADYPSITGIGYLSKKSARQHIIPLLALGDHFAKEEVNLLARNIEALAFYYATLNIQTKNYESTFAKWAMNIRGLKTNEALIQFITEEIGVELLRQKASFNDKFANKSFGDIQPQYRIKYILGRLDNFIRTACFFPLADVSFYQEQQLEHILPQTGENIPEENYPETNDYSIAVSRVGNLTLLEQPINGSLNNTNDLSTGDWFIAKKNAYKKSHMLLTSTIPENTIGTNTAYNRFVAANLVHFDVWDRDKINERQQMLKKLMLKTWTLTLV